MVIGNLTAHLDQLTVETLVLTELAQFDADWNVQPVPAVQEFRSGSIAWLATFAPESFTENAVTELRRICQLFRHRADYSHTGWYRQAYLESAMFALTGELTWVRTIVTNLDHESSTLRSSLHGPLGLVAPRVALTDLDVIARMTRNIEVAHFFNESMLCIFCALHGETKDKLDIATAWRRAAKLAPQDQDSLGRLCQHQDLSNVFLLDEYSEINRYLVCRLLDPEVRTTVVVPRIVQGDLFGPTSSMPSLGEVWQRMSAHPLMRPYVRMPLPTNPTSSVN